MEVVCQLQLACDIGLVDEYTLNKINELIDEIAKMLTALRKAQLSA